MDFDLVVTTGHAVGWPDAPRFEGLAAVLGAAVLDGFVQQKTEPETDAC